MRVLIQIGTAPIFNKPKLFADDHVATLTKLNGTRNRIKRVFATKRPRLCAILSNPLLANWRRGFKVCNSNRLKKAAIGIRLIGLTSSTDYVICMLSLISYLLCVATHFKTLFPSTQRTIGSHSFISTFASAKATSKIPTPVSAAFT